MAGSNNLANLRAGYSSHGQRINVIEADYTRPPMRGTANLVIAVAPGPAPFEHATVEYPLAAARSAGNLVGPGGEVYMVADLIHNEAEAQLIKLTLERTIKSRGLQAEIQVDYVPNIDVARGRNPVGIPLQSIHLSDYGFSWQVYARVAP